MLCPRCHVLMIIDSYTDTPEYNEAQSHCPLCNYYEEERYNKYKGVNK